MQTFLRPFIGIALWSLVLAGCSSQKLQVTFEADNFLNTNQVWDNSFSLQSGSTTASESVTVLLHAGRAGVADLAKPAPPALLQLQGMTRLHATLLYDPEIIEFSGFTPGTFLEQTSGNQTVRYDIVAAQENNQQTGKLQIDISVPQSVQNDAVRRGDVVKLEFASVKAGYSHLQFEGGFGTLERGTRNITGVSYYGGGFTIAESSTQ